ncbi:MAG: Cobalt-precorrin-2 C(20)-methyltransferase [Chroococcopsis gigantea SAG 12.99]|nr:Cobalt-precorrin-2 C(20)-methyltransferase [Chroococcopsis gigantea SAG 12.99]
MYGISVGTGDPELITVKGLRILQESPVVAFPSGIDGKPGIAEGIIRSWLQPAQKTIALDFPYVLDQYLLEKAWQTAAQSVWEFLQRGLDVAFACEGDVSFYSTFTYLAHTLRTNYPEVEIISISGVCSPLGAASVLGLPLTIRNQRLAVLPALYHVKELENVLQWADVIVLMKVSSVYGEVWQLLKEKNLLSHSWLVEKATFPNQKIYPDLSSYPDLKLSYFSIMVINVTGTLSPYHF